jgi:aspartate racemase
MKTLGIIGGLSWFSTAVYYKTINELVQERLGGSHSARLILYSVDFDEFKTLQERGDWGGTEALLVGIARRLEQAGAEGLVMASNTPHMVADGIRRNIGIPLIHVAEESAREIVRRKMATVGLLGTRFTMEQSFFKEKLAQQAITAVIPEPDDREFLHSAIFAELTKGIFKADTKARLVGIIESLRRQGAEGIVFGCTEIGLMLGSADSPLPILDTTAIHAAAAVDFAITPR